MEAHNDYRKGRSEETVIKYHDTGSHHGPLIKTSPLGTKYPLLGAICQSPLLLVSRYDKDTY